MSQRPNARPGRPGRPQESSMPNSFAHVFPWQLTFQGEDKTVDTPMVLPPAGSKQKYRVSLLIPYAAVGRHLEGTNGYLRPKSDAHCMILLTRYEVFGGRARVHDESISLDTEWQPDARTDTVNDCFFFVTKERFCPLELKAGYYTIQALFFKDRATVVPDVIVPKCRDFVELVAELGP